MNKILFFLLAMALLSCANSHEIAPKTSSTATTERPQPVGNVSLDVLDEEITQMLSEVSAENLYHIIETLVSFHTRHTMSVADDPELGIGAARQWIKEELLRYSEATGGRLLVTFDGYLQEVTNRISEPTEIVNVVATLPGTNPNDDRIFVVSGHYDSRVTDVMDATSYSPGANDDASGTAAVMEMARIMSQYEFEATLVFMAVSGEEQGLFGARHFAENARANGKNIAGMFTNDIIGSPIADNGRRMDHTVRLFAQGLPARRELSNEILAYIRTGGENDLPTRQLARSIKETAESYLPEMDVWMIYRTDRYLRGGDHIPFLDLGYPAVRFSEPNENFRHQHQDVREENGVFYGDEIDFIDADYIARVTQVNMAAMANLARAPQSPKSVGMDISQLTNSTTLVWEMPDVTDNLAGFEIVWRETTSPVWQWKHFAGKVSEYTIPDFNKDNYLFGVRSVSLGGHTSPAVYPMPVRR